MLFQQYSAMLWRPFTWSRYLEIIYNSILTKVLKVTKSSLLETEVKGVCVAHQQADTAITSLLNVHLSVTLNKLACLNWQCVFLGTHQSASDPPKINKCVLTMQQHDRRKILTLQVWPCTKASVWNQSTRKSILEKNTFGNHHQDRKIEESKTWHQCVTLTFQLRTTHFLMVFCMSVNFKIPVTLMQWNACILSLQRADNREMTPYMFIVWRWHSLHKILSLY